MLSNHFLCCIFLLLPHSFPASGSFPMSRFFALGVQCIGVSASASVLPMNIQGWFPLGLIGLISLQSKGLPRIFSSTILQKHQFFGHSAFFMVQLSHPYMTTGKTITLTIQTPASKVMSLLFNMLSRFIIVFLSWSKRLLISWLQSPSAVIFEPPKIVSHCFHCFPIYLPWSDGTGYHDLSFLNVEFQASFSTLLFYFHQEAL